MLKRAMIPPVGDGSATSRRYLRQTPGPVYAVALLVPVLAMAAARWAGVTPAEMLRDPIMLAGGSGSDFYLGLFSNLGVVLWTATAAICLFAASELTEVSNCRARHFLLYGGFFTLLLMLDDLFMLHENYADTTNYILYGMVLLYYVIRFFRLIVRLDVVLFALAVLFFGGSAVIDLALWRMLSDEGVELPSDLRYLLEDGFKFVGICCWATFHIRAARLLRRPGAETAMA